MDFKTMTDSELASVMINHITRVEQLLKIISKHLDNPQDCCIPAYKIKNEYANLKKEIQEDSHYLSLSKNYRGSDLYMYKFAPSIREAAAYGFRVPTNGAVDHKMCSAVEEAHYKLTKYYSLEEWGKRM